MSNIQKSAGVAEELADAQQEISIAEFFEQNKQMLGFGSKTRALVTATKEAVDNSIDAAEEANIFPDISVEIQKKEEYYTLIVEDNGPGIPKENVPNVFGKLLYGSRFHARAQRRGQQGIGISAAVLYSQLTSGNPARITSKPANKEKGYYAELGIDTDTNEPVIQNDESITWDKDHGTRIELDMEGNMRARKRLHQYIRQTAVVNPHAKLSLKEPDAELVFDERSVDELPDDVEEIQPHPHGVELGTLIDMLEATDSYKLRSFFQTDFTRVGETTADTILNNFRDRHYGRTFAWPAFYNVEKGTYISGIKNVINRKGKDATDLFAVSIVDKLAEEEYVTREDIEKIVSDVSESVQDKTGTKFKETVQSNTVESIWTILESNISEFTIERVDEKTIDRKNNELVQKFGERLAEQFISRGYHLFTKEELTDAVEKASEYASRRVDTGSSFGETAQEKVIEDFWERAEHVDRDVPKIKDAVERDVAKNLLEAMRASKVMAPPTKCLSPISEENIVIGLKSQYNADFYTSVTRGAGVNRGEPFIIEAGIAYGGDLESNSQIELNRYANRVPLVYQQGACAITKTVKGITWNNYYRKRDKLSQNSNSIPQGPMVLVVHVASTNVPFTSESKDAVSSVPEIEDEIERAVRSVARDLKDHLKEKRSRKKRKQKRDKIGGILKDMSDKLENVTGEEIESKQKSQAKILNNVFINTDGPGVEITNYSGKTETINVTFKCTEKVNSIEESDSISIEDNKITVTIDMPSKDSNKIHIEENIEEISVESPVQAKVTKT